MMTRKRLIKLFGRAAAKGWKANDEDFPEVITGEFWPDESNLFRALEEIAPKDVRFLILGQDPYSDTDGKGTPHATGVAFAVDSRCDDPPKSLNRIRQAVDPEGNCPPDLLSWRTDNRILLLNAALTVPRQSDGQDARAVAGKHLRLWRQLTTKLVMQVRQANKGAELIAWGAEARNIICDALKRSGAFSYARHPATNGGGVKSFEAFWDTPVGRSLRSR